MIPPAIRPTNGARPYRRLPGHALRFRQFPRAWMCDCRATITSGDAGRHKAADIYRFHLLDVLMAPSETIARLFWPKVEKSDSCWVWRGLVDPHGYGRFTAKPFGIDTRAHRVSWELHNGPIPDGLNVCHHCDNPPCVRPDHLFLGTQADNIHDMIDKGRKYHPPTVEVCGKGHPMVGDNVYLYRGGRRCKACNRTQATAYYHRSRAGAAAMKALLAAPPTPTPQEP